MALNNDEKTTVFGLSAGSLLLFIIAGYLFFLKYPPGKVVRSSGGKGRMSSEYISTWADILQSTLIPLAPAIILLVCLVVYLVRRMNRVDE